MRKIIAIVLSVIFIVAATLTVSAQINPGDVNGDGSVNNKDVALLFRYLIGYRYDFFNEENADINGDGTINNKDYTMLFKTLLNPGEGLLLLKSTAAKRSEFALFKEPQKLSFNNKNSKIAYDEKSGLLIRRKVLNEMPDFLTVNILGNEYKGVFKDCFYCFASNCKTVVRYTILDEDEKPTFGYFDIDFDSGKVSEFYSPELNVIFTDTYNQKVNNTFVPISEEEVLENKDFYKSIGDDLAKDYIENIDDFKFDMIITSFNTIVLNYTKDVKGSDDVSVCDYFSISVSFDGSTIYSYNFSNANAVSVKEMPETFDKEKILEFCKKEFVESQKSQNVEIYDVSANLGGMYELDGNVIISVYVMNKLTENIYDQYNDISYTYGTLISSETYYVIL